MKSSSLTRRMLLEMMKENTGTHLLDSGGIYGRHWEKNQKVNFLKMPPATVEFEHWISSTGQPVWYMDYTRNTFWHLLESVEFCSEVQKAWRAFCRNGNRRDEEFNPFSIYQMEAFAQGRSDKWHKHDIACDNCYNYDQCLSQVIQFVSWEDEAAQEMLVLLQIHGGCDVRGGYTKPRVFRMLEDYSLWDWNKGTLFCPNKNCHARWFSEDAGHSWEGDSLYLENDAQGRLFTLEEVRAGFKQLPHLESYPWIPEKDFRPEEHRNHLVLLNDKSALCPNCQKGVLQAGL